jgi:hypothetical protein
MSIPYGCFMKYGIEVRVAEQRQGRVGPNDGQELLVVDVKGLGGKRFLGCSRRKELLRDSVNLDEVALYTGYVPKIHPSGTEEAHYEAH